MTWLGRLVPAPLTSAALLAVWLALARSTSAGQILLGTVIALLAPLTARGLYGARLHVKRPLVIARYILTVGFDVVVSSFQVAWGVLLWRWRRPQSKFVIVPLDLRDPHGLAALAMVTTVVPGTVWSEIALDSSALLLHVWDVPQEGAFIERFKHRYEGPLREIFE